MPEDGEGSLKEVTGPHTPRESGEQTRPALPAQPTLRAPSRGGSLRPRGASAHSAMAATRPRGRVCGGVLPFLHGLSSSSTPRIPSGPRR